MVFWRPRDERGVFLMNVVEILLKRSSEAHVVDIMDVSGDLERICVRE